MAEKEFKPRVFEFMIGKDLDHPNIVRYYYF